MIKPDTIALRREHIFRMKQGQNINSTALGTFVSTPCHPHLLKLWSHLINTLPSALSPSEVFIGAAFLRTGLAQMLAEEDIDQRGKVGKNCRIFRGQGEPDQSRKQDQEKLGKGKNSY